MNASLIFFGFFGLAIGSFLNVLSLRYDPDKFLLSAHVLHGRSHCPKCKKTLQWFELIPVLSYVLQLGKCRTCKTHISFQYPIVEFLTGLIFVFVSQKVYNLFLIHDSCFVIHGSCFMIYVLWTLVFVSLLLMSLIDLRTRLIPNEINIFLVILGFVLLVLYSFTLNATPQTLNALSIPYTLNANPSFLGSYALIFGFTENIWLNHFFAAFVGVIFFGFLVLITRGKGMGIGDVKLAGALGFVFGWADIAFIIMFSFIIGSIFGVFGMLRGKLGMKSAVPFGPFLALGAMVVFFWGEDLLRWYFGLIQAFSV